MCLIFASEKLSKLYSAAKVSQKINIITKFNVIIWTNYPPLGIKCIRNWLGILSLLNLDD